jgi:transposase-like protein
MASSEGDKRKRSAFRAYVRSILSESVEARPYQQLFRSLKARGLRGVELVVSDDHEGLKAAVLRHFQGASHQRCQVHYVRNLLGMIGAIKRKELAADLRGVSPRPTGALPSS